MWSILAFDRIDHELLLKLEVKRTWVHGFETELFKATSGVPQGSNLGPLLFLLFINDLTNTVKCDKMLFAVDMKIFAEISSIGDCEELLTL